MSATPSSTTCTCPACQPALGEANANNTAAMMAAPVMALSQVTAAPTRLNSAEAAAEEVFRQATIAKNDANSYGVGGAIVETATGRIIHAYGNRVNGQLASGMWFATPDPTNHGETQLVGWYYDNRAAIRQQLGYLPTPRQLTVVTSLDPCAMCAGTLLTAGFNVAVIAPDDSGGGVNWASTGEFAHVPPAVQAALRTNFGYYSVTGVDLRAEYIGGPNVIYRRQTISQDVYQKNFDVFADSVPNVTEIRKTRPRPGDLSDIAPAGGTPSDAAAIRQQLVAQWPGALSVKLPAENQFADAELTALGIEAGDLGKKIYYRPSDELYDLLRNAQASAPGSKNALAMIDRFGNVLAVGVDTPAKSPIATSMMNIVSGFSRWSFARMSDASVAAPTLTELKQTAPYKYLSPVALNTFIYLKAPNPNEVATLKDLGIFGNSNDGVLQYIEPPVRGTMKQLDDQIRALPLYYSESEHVSAVQSVPPAARLTVTNLDNSGTGSLRWAIDQANAAGRYRQITFADNLQGTIGITSPLPLIRVPFTIDGRAAVANPFAPRFAAAPLVAIDFNGRAGLRFAASATGSQVMGLALGGAGSYAISSLTQSLEITGNRFGVNLAGASDPNRRGSFDGVASRAVITAPESPLMTTTRKADVHRPLVFSGDTLVSGVRTDAVGGTIDVGLDPDGPGGLAPTYFSVDPAAPRALTSAAIESALAGATAAWRAAYGKQQGGSFVMDVTAGSWEPVAKLPLAAGGQELTLTWLTQVGGTATAEFSLAPRVVLPSDGSRALLPYLGKTWTVSYMAPMSGSDTRGQASETAISLMRLGTSSVAVGFYSVADDASGAIGSLRPENAGYAAAALAAARASGLMFAEGNRLPAQGGIRTVSAGNFDPTKSYGIVFTVGGDASTAVTSYQKPGTVPGSQYRFRAFALLGGRSAVGIEASPTVSSRDFADLVVTLPSNLRVRSRV